MADFDAILRKALAARPDAPGDERRKIYERARQALVRQLTSFEPPLPPEDISRQRLALESAIRKVEADVAAGGGTLAATPAAPVAAAAAPAPAPAAPVAPVSRAAPVAPPPAAAPAQPAYEAAPDFAEPAPSFEPEPMQPAPAYPEAAAPAPKKKGGSGIAGMMVGVIGLVVIGAGGVAAWQLGLLDPYLNTGDDNGTVAEQPLEEAPDVRTVGTDPTQSADRLLPDNQGAVEEETTTAETETDTSTPEAGTTGLPVAQTAILYEEGLTADEDGFTAPGRTVWRLDQAGTGPAIVGTIEVPARGISITMRITENGDDALPATHLIEFGFELSEAFPATGIAELVGVVVKPQEQAGGDPLRGAIVDLGNGVFWQALASGEADQAVNVPLLRDGRWFDLPVLYDDNRRAIITFEKGDDGVAVFQQALNAWSSN